MKALYASKNGDYELRDMPVPAMGPDDALVQVERAGLCHTDVMIRNKEVEFQRPFIPGHEFAGIITACGPAAKHVQIGDRVVVHSHIGCHQCSRCRRGDNLGCENLQLVGAGRDGGFAEYCAVPARDLLKIPDHVTFAAAAMIEPLANAISAVRQSTVQAGERVVIIGPGPIGLLALQVARLAYPSVLALVGTRDARLSLGLALGASHIVNISNAKASDALAAMLGGKGADVIIECAGSRTALELAMEVVGWRGRITVEGVFPENVAVPMFPRQLQNRSATLVTVNGWVTAEFEQALSLLSTGLVKVEPLVSHTLPLDEWEEAFGLATRHKDAAMKVQFAPSAVST